MPFGHNCEFATFDACVAHFRGKGRSEEQARNICGALQRDTEGACRKKDLTTGLKTLFDSIVEIKRSLDPSTRDLNRLRIKLDELFDRFDWDEFVRDLKIPFTQLYRNIVFEQGNRAMRAINRARHHRRRANADVPESKAKKPALAFNREDPAMRRKMTDYVGRQIKELKGTTKREVVDLIRGVLDERGGTGTTGELGDAIMEKVREKFAGYEDWRADRIARTETAVAYNHGTVYAADQAGIRKVEVSDGDEDEECAQANGQIWTLDEALEKPVAHPNCTRAFSPVFEDE